jgi:hypothetical protein
MQPLAEGYGGCIATRLIVDDGYPIRFMYREGPDNEIDSGWRLLSGFESDDYMEDADNHVVIDVNTAANLDPSIIRHLDAPAGSAFERPDIEKEFEQVFDWVSPDEEED